MNSNHELARLALESTYLEGAELETRRAKAAEQYEAARMRLLKAGEVTWNAYEDMMLPGILPRLSAAHRAAAHVAVLKSLPITFDALNEYVEAIDGIFEIFDELMEHQQKMNAATNAYLASTDDGLRH